MEHRLDRQRLLQFSQPGERSGVGLEWWSWRSSGVRRSGTAGQQQCHAAMANRSGPLVWCTSSRMRVRRCSTQWCRIGRRLFNAHIFHVRGGDHARVHHGFDFGNQPLQVFRRIHNGNHNGLILPDEAMAVDLGRSPYPSRPRNTVAASASGSPAATLKNYPLPRVSPNESLNALMEERGLKHKYIWPVLGNKGAATEVLSGRRSISKAQAKRLAEFFHVPIDLFV